MTGPQPSAGRRYLSGVIGILEKISRDQWPYIRTAAGFVTDTVSNGGLVHVFGTGHSHMLAEELFYRAGGLAAANPILVESLMLHAGAETSTQLERRTGLARNILADHPLEPGDTLIVASNSGGNAVTEELTQLARAAGAQVIAIISRRHAGHSSEERDGSRLVDLAHVVIDNHGEVGDASVVIEGFGRRVGATSTVAGAAIVNAIVAEAVEMLVARGEAAEVLVSSNLSEGDAANAELLARYKGRVKSL